LGRNSTADSLVPVAVDTSGVLAGVSLASISAGAAATCAVSTVGKVYCWGAGSGGLLGTGATTPSLVPVAATAGALAGATISSIDMRVTSGGGVACAVDTAGAVSCWGNNSDGEGGPGPNPLIVPTHIVLPAGTTAVAVATNNGTSCALVAGGATYCWGLGTSGQLGNGGMQNSVTPVAVVPTCPTNSGPLANGTCSLVSGARYYYQLSYSYLEWVSLTKQAQRN
jgi:alpha-tubulin suppressor-like RCC1 family protein